MADLGPKGAYILRYSTLVCGACRGPRLCVALLRATLQAGETLLSSSDLLDCVLTRDTQKGYHTVRISFGSDHAGFDLKQHLIAFLQAQGHEIVDCGTDSDESVDYPEFCAEAGRAVVRGQADLGIVMGGSGQGEQLAANKVKGVRAALCNDLYLARMARSHNDANVLSIGARVVGIGLAEEIVSTFLTTEFEGGRHQRRVDQVMAIESE
ncbi:MAG: ribose 5-phosphate isomerase B [Acidimicrobiales bacterium]|jgi:ribose 5-phosphate isomerase B